MAASGYASALQALAVVAGAVALQQYSQRRAKQLATTAQPPTATSQAVQRKSTTLPLASLRDGGDDGPLFVVEIEYCTGCRWMLRAAWMAQELLTTFQQDAVSRLRSVVLTPNSRQGGVFQVYLHATDGSVERELLWSRKLAGRFPESKELKQIVRDYINPDKGLGHSDKK
jgi:selenoprotein W-related protein